MSSRRYLARTSISCNLQVEIDDLLEEVTPAQHGTKFNLSQEKRELSDYLTFNAIIATQENSHAQAQANQGSTSDFESIGAGTCGSVFRPVERPIAIKIQKTWLPQHDLHMEAMQHMEILSSLERYPVANIKLTQVYDYKNGEEAAEFFKEHPELEKQAREKVNLPMPLLISDRIMPLPEPIREHLITLFCPPNLQDNVREDKANNNCLVRVYLGQDQQRPWRFFTLRNFKLYLDNMESLQLDIEGMAFTMGQTLAVLHYVAQTDARDVEFVLGSTPQRKVMRMKDLENEQTNKDQVTSSGLDEWERLLDYRYRKTELYLLDFNQCRFMSQDEKGIEQAVHAYLENDPYYPRPFSNTRRGTLAWHSFAAAYIDQAQYILRDPNMVDSLACGFLRKIRKHFKDKLAAAAAKMEEKTI